MSNFNLFYGNNTASVLQPLLKIRKPKLKLKNLRFIAKISPGILRAVQQPNNVIKGYSDICSPSFPVCWYVVEFWCVIDDNNISKVLIIGWSSINASQGVRKNENCHIMMLRYDVHLSFFIWKFLPLTTSCYGQSCC